MRPIRSTAEILLSSGLGIRFSIQEQLLRSDEKQFQGGLVFKARRLVHHSTLKPRVIKKKKIRSWVPRSRWQAAWVLRFMVWGLGFGVEDLV